MLELFTRLPTQAHLRAYEEQLETGSQLAGWLRPWMQYAQFFLLNDPGEKAVRGRGDWFFYRPGVEYLTQRLPAEPSQGDPVTAICDFRDQLAARGIHLIVLPAPNKESIYPEQLGGRGKSVASAPGTATRTVMDRLRHSGVEVLDLFEHYGRARSETALEPGSPLYLVQDSHWSPAGVELAAQALAQRLLARGWAKPGNANYVGRAVSTRRIGDVLRMLKVPRIEAWFGAERVSAVQVIDGATGESYRDDPGAEILVLGDSFLRIYEQDEPGAAGLVAHLARELRQPVASIVNDGGASTLVRQELHRRAALLKNARVVVWEFVERDIRLGLEGWQQVPLPAAAAGASNVVLRAKPSDRTTSPPDRPVLNAEQ